MAIAAVVPAFATGVVVGIAAPVAAAGVSNWTQVTLPLLQGHTTAGLYDVSCASSTSCVAVGGTLSSTADPVAEILSGTTWTPTTLPVPHGHATATLYSVSCAAVTSCVAVGTTDGTPAAPVAETLAGTTWTPTILPLPSGSASDSLTSISCVASTSCVAVGASRSTSTPVAETLSGTTWTPTDLPLAPGYTTTIPFGVSCTTATSCVAIGTATADYTTPATAPVAETLSGTTWSATDLPFPTNYSTTILNSVSCISSTSCVAVGASTLDPATDAPVAEILSGTTWSAAILASPTGDVNATLTSVSCPSPSSCVAVGATTNFGVPAPVAETLSATTWSAANLSGTAATPNAVSCVSSASCVAVGATDQNTPVAYTYTSAPACVPGVLDNCVFKEATPFAMDAAPVGGTTQTLSDIVENVTTQPQPITDVGVFDAADMPNNTTTDSASLGIPGTAWPISATTEFTLPAGDTCAGTTLQPGQSCAIPFAFHPLTAGSVANFLCINYTAGASIGDCIGLDGTTTASGGATLPPGCSGSTCPGLGTGVQVIPTFDARNKNISPAAYPFGIEAQSLDFVPSTTTPGTTTTHSITIINSTSQATTPFALGLAQGTVAPREYAIGATTCPASGSAAYPYGPLAPGGACTVQVTWTVPGGGTPYTAGSLTVESDVPAGPSTGSAYGAIGLLADNQVTPGGNPRLTPSFAITPSRTQVLGTGAACTTTTCTFGLDPSAYGGTAGDTLTFLWSWSGTDAAGKTISGTATTTGVCDATCTAATSGVAIPAGDTTVTLPESASPSPGIYTPYQVNLFVEDVTTPATMVAPVHFQDVTVLPQTVTSCPAGDLGIAPTSGEGQSALAGTTFGAPVIATVTCDATVPPLPVTGAVVTFTQPASTGPSGTPSPSSVTTPSSGIATSTVTADQSVGSWTLEASGVLDSVATTTPAAFALTNTPGTIPTTTTVTCSPNPSRATTLVTCTSTTVASATGIAVTSGAVTSTGPSSVVLDPSPVNPHGQTTFTTATLPLGSDRVTSAYLGTGTYEPSQGSTTEVVDTIPTTTTVSCSPNPSLAGTSVTCTVTVTAPTGPIPTGTVTLTTPTGTLGTCTLTGGTCAIATTAFPPGTTTVTATYPGSATDQPSSGTTTQQTSIPAALCGAGTLVIAATSGSGQTTLATTAFGAPVVATITCAEPGSSVVALVDGAQVVFVPPPTGASGLPAPTTEPTGAAGTATTTVTADGVVGAWTLSGTASTTTSSGTAVTTATPATWLLTNKAGDIPTATTVTCSPNPSLAGTSVTCTVAVTASTGPIPTGTVTLTTPTGTLGTCTLASGTCSIATTAFPPGTTTVGATYSGSSIDQPSSGTTTHATSIALASCNLATLVTTASAGSGQDAVVKKAFANPVVATVTCAEPGSSVVVLVDGATVTFIPPGTGPSGTPAPLSGLTGTDGTATTTVRANTTVGAWQLTGSASGGPASGDATWALANVKPAPPVPTTTTVVCSPNPSIVTHLVTCTSATVVTATDTPVTSGIVTTAAPGGSVLASGPVDSSGVTTLATTTLPVGTTQMTASYAGTSTDAPSQGTTTEVVATIPTTTTVACSPDPAAVRARVTCVSTTVVSATGTPVTSGIVTTTGPGSSSLGTNPVDSSGVTTIATSGLPLGTDPVAASYAGTATLGASRGQATAVVQAAAVCPTGEAGTYPRCSPPTTPPPVVPVVSIVPVVPVVPTTTSTTGPTPTKTTTPATTSTTTPNKTVTTHPATRRIVVATITTVTCSPTHQMLPHIHPVHCVAIVRTAGGQIPPGGVFHFALDGAVHHLGPWGIGRRGNRSLPSFTPAKNGNYVAAAFYSGTTVGSVTYLASHGSAASFVGLLVCLVPSSKISLGWFLATGLPWLLFVAVALLIAYGFLLRRRYLEEDVERDRVYATDDDPDYDPTEVLP